MLNFADPKNSKKVPKRQTFSKENRFNHYTFLKQVTGSLVGPGTYNNHLNADKQQKLPCQVKLKQLAGISQFNSDGYLFVGDQLVYEPVFMTKNEKIDKRKYNTSDLSVDMHSGISAIMSKFYEGNQPPKTAINENNGNRSIRDGNSELFKIYGCYSSQKNHRKKNLKTQSDYGENVLNVGNEFAEKSSLKEINRENKKIGKESEDLIKRVEEHKNEIKIDQI